MIKQHSHPVFPEPLRKGDTLAILAPASIVKKEYVEEAARLFSAEGYDVRVLGSAVSEGTGSYSAPKDVRIAEFLEAWKDPSVRCILCARGGYGAIHLLEDLDETLSFDNPKWLVGFSDISALHALMNRHEIVSLHAPMVKHLATRGHDAATRMLLRALRGEHNLEITGPTSSFNIPGEATGRLVGGNLAVLNSLASTRFDMLSSPLTDDCILYLEDISEAIYAVERMLFRLRMAGVFNHTKGIIIGRFTEYRPDRNFKDMETMIATRFKEWGIDNIPVAFDFPIGHIECNMPILNSAPAKLTVSKEKSTLVERL